MLKIKMIVLLIQQYNKYVCFVMRDGRNPKKIAKFGNQYEFIWLFSQMCKDYYALNGDEFVWRMEGGSYQFSFAENEWDFHKTLEYDTFERIGVRVSVAA